ncbi:MAG: NADH-quinone oxidoreductase subunit L [bacterium]
MTQVPTALAAVPLIPLLPLFGAAMNGILGRTFNRTVVSAIGCGTLGISFALTVWAFLAFPAGAEPHVLTLFPWIQAGGFHVDAGLQIDQLSLTLMLVVTGVGFLIHVYSTAYMHEDPSYARYFAYLNLFVFAMSMLVLGSSLPLMFLGWEGVGLCSYLLIGFWFEDPAKASAGKKAFIVNRIGDAGFILGVLWLYQATGRVDFEGLRAAIQANPGLVSGAATGIGLLLFVGACGKSAQIPLYVWLPDAMAGPTPVSALIHAATMVTAGVYMIARLNFVYVLAPVAMTVVACVGAATALFAGTIGLAQWDIKKVLAYSTVSQLGYMFLAVGVGAFDAGVFHLVTHAFFKALLFLGSGSVIHALGGEQDIRKMGGLAKKIPGTCATFVIGTIAIAGIWPFAGFYSKDEILIGALVHRNPVVGVLPQVLCAVGLVAAIITAFYMWRLTVLTFFSPSRMDHEVEHHVHESPIAMLGPLVILAVLSAGAGAFLVHVRPLHHFLEPIFEIVGAAPPWGTVDEHALHTAESSLPIVSVLAALAASGAAFAIFRRGVPPIPKSVEPVQTLLENKYWVDEGYAAAIVRPFWAVSRWLWRFVDAVVIDGIVNGVAAVAVATSGAVRRWTTGNTQIYALSIFLGLLALLAALTIV